MNTKTSYLSELLTLLSFPVVQCVLGLLIVLTVSAIAYYVLIKLRDSTSNDQLDVTSLEKNFEEMRSGGDINESEFRNIKALLGSVDVASAGPKRTAASPHVDDASQKEASSGP